MKQYKKIPIWENLRRTNFLIEFSNLVVEYINKDKFVGDDSSSPKYEEVQKIRKKINLKSNEARSIILSSGITLGITQTEPSAIGGRAFHYDLINDIFFLLEQPFFDYRAITDCLERSIGIYEADKTNAFWRTRNPFYWLISILEFIISIPFKILGYAGLDQEKIESSFLGKLIKAIFYLITVFAALLIILEKLGFLEWFKNLIFLK